MINDSINRFLGVLCYPLTSMETFRQDLIQEYLEAMQDKDTKKAKKLRDSLRSQLVGYIRQNYNLYSYDEIYLYLEKCYLYDVQKFEDTMELYFYTMERIARSLISHRDGQIVFKYWKNKEDKELFGGFAENNKVMLFHSLNCHIPMDVIAILYMVLNQEEKNINCLDGFYGNIDVADKQLSRVLEGGVAENHLHKGVSRTFPSIWDSLMEPLTVKKGKVLQQTRFVNGTAEQNERMIYYILGCGIVRAYLVLTKGKDSDEQKGKDIRVFVEMFREGQPFEDFFYHYSAFQEKKNRAKEIIAYYVQLWNDLTYISSDEMLPNKLYTQILEDRISIHTLTENIFLYDTFYDIYHLHKNCEDNENSFRKQCFLQYLRVRNYLFHVSVQQKTIKGLDYFQQEHYGINSALNHANIKNFWEHAIREQFQNQYLSKIEFRTSMPESYSAFKKEVVHFLKAYKEILVTEYCDEEGVSVRRIPRAGLVIHFLKREDETVPEKCLQNGRTECSYLHFGQIQQSYQKQIEAFKQLRSEFGEVSRFLVGIDAASLENATPVWVFAPIYEKARDSGIELIGKDTFSGKYMQSLGFTFHAGEDFRHILSGLRRIDEVVEYLKFHAGDRIGHGIALGIPAAKWKEQNPVIIIPRIEALENYLWAYDALSKNYSDFQAAILTYMEKQIYELSRKIYGCEDGGIRIELLIDGYHQLFRDSENDFESVEWMSVEENLCRKLRAQERIDWNPSLLAAARHCKIFVGKMERPIHCEVTEQDLLIIEELQEIMKKKLGRKGIVVEVNPSSNTAIADLEVLEDSQFYQMNQMNGDQNVIVCINSDDPAVFNTNVSNELAYIYYGMLEKGISREMALLWIERVQKNGMNSSFIRREESDEAFVKKLVELTQKM